MKRVMPSPHLGSEWARVFSWVLRLGDAACIALGGVLAYAWRFDHAQMIDSYVWAISLVTLLSMFVFPLFRLYEDVLHRDFFSHLASLLVACLVVAGVVTTLLFFSKSGAQFSRQWVAQWALIASLGAIIIRAIVKGSLAVGGRYAPRMRVGVVGCGPVGCELAERLKKRPWEGYRVAAFFDDNVDGGSKTAVPVFDLNDVVECVRTLNLDEIWFALPLKAEDKIREVAHSLRFTPLPMRLIPDIYAYRLMNHSVSMVAGMPVLTLNETPMRGFNRILKAMEDKVLASVMLLMLAPVMLCVAIAIKIDSKGPVFFKQKRHGWYGKEIMVWKFRSMTASSSQSSDVIQARRNDSRITRVGAFLRRTSLDELPQLFNVLSGEMSLVGPRPHAIQHTEQYKDLVDSYMFRHKVKPGITGWAQVNGFRGETDELEKMVKRVEYDLYYIEHWSLWFDVKIIFMTVVRGFVHPNAY